MRLAYLLFDELTTLDFIGFYDPVSRLRSRGYLPELSWDLCAPTPVVRDNFGLTIQVDEVLPDLSGYDLLYVPGGFGTRARAQEAAFVEWVKTAAPVPLKVSVCTGSLILGAAGFLEGKRATTHYGEYERLGAYTDRISEERIVEDEGVITGGAVSAALDLGLYVCEKLAGAQAANDIRQSMNYAPSHPLDGM